ncbi:GNAT family N-acetyltransferase [Pseudarthrobacter sp. N5]|uniref:GNAT family N-acetyltransferase n=1 Tax=Pseudarthrobacter sp. N5 TaxID=3418416 RepID=UPI003CF38AF9
MTELAITAVVIPEKLDDALPQGVRGPGEARDASDFRDCCALRDAHLLEVWGNLDRCATVQEGLQFWRGNDYEERLLFIARLGGEAVGLCSVILPLKENLSDADIDVLVVPAHRRNGIGRRLLEFVEQLAVSRGRTVFDACSDMLAGCVAEAAGLLMAKSGTGGLPLDAAATAFALGAGYQLEQVETSGQLQLPVPSEHLDALESEARERAADYRLAEWKDACPEALVDAYAVLKGKITVDVPMAGMDWGPENWDAARVREEERAWAMGGIESLVAGALHMETGALAAYSVLNRRQMMPGILNQEDTFVDSGHRGHRLGMLTKIANIRRAQRSWPEGLSITTWNASENQHMLAINTSLGFRPAGYEGEWQKRLE